MLIRACRSFLKKRTVHSWNMNEFYYCAKNLRNLSPEIRTPEINDSHLYVNCCPVSGNKDWIEAEVILSAGVIARHRGSQNFAVVHRAKSLLFFNGLIFCQKITNDIFLEESSRRELSIYAIKSDQIRVLKEPCTCKKNLYRFLCYFPLVNSLTAIIATILAIKMHWM